MRALFDVNVLLALFDAEHSRHDDARSLMTLNCEFGWASCPLTENGFARIMSRTSYTNPVLTMEAMSILRAQQRESDHEFWPDDVSITDADVFDHSRILGPNQITDLYLLALAVKRDGRLVTFDRGIPLSAVRGAEARHLVVI